MYGTVMTGRLADGMTIDDYDVVAKDWLAREVDGFVDEYVMLGEDGRSVLVAVRFRDRAAYQALADDPLQDEFYQSRIRPLLAADPQWTDGEWVGEYSA
ncbi:MAG TPA: hypothetical protein VNA14_11010 [Mycobacteriales bacterium]|nr:hypothetical protein [Mycobacteriales bacterium]